MRATLMNREALHVHDLIVKPTLAGLGLGGDTAERFITCIGEYESKYDNLRQVLTSGNYGAAWGWWQCEKPTFDDDVRYLLDERYELLPKLLQICGVKELPPITAMTWNLRFAAAMCRIHFLRFKEPIPSDLEGMARYYKKYYNGDGKGTVDGFIRDCKDIFK